MVTIPTSAEPITATSRDLVNTTWYKFFSEVGQISPFMQTVLDDPDAATAQTTLGITGGWRNRVINGDFQIDQRNAFAPKLVNATGIFGPDRWMGSANGGGAFFLVPSQAAAQMGLAVQTVDVSLAADDYYLFGQMIEGYNVRDLRWGTVLAKPITISFEAYCTSAPGPFTVCVRNSPAARSWLGTFSLSAVATWEQKTFTIPGDTTGTWATDNTSGLQVFICMASGSTYGSGAAGWQAGNHVAQAGQVNFMTSTSNGLYIRNFQLEAGSIATEFERVEYSEQLARCQRYYQKTFPITIVPGNSVTATGSIFCAVQTVTGYYSAQWEFPTIMRATPSVVTYSPAGGTAGYWRDGSNSLSSQPLVTPAENGVLIYMNNALMQAWSANVFNIQATASAEL